MFHPPPLLLKARTEWTEGTTETSSNQHALPTLWLVAWKRPREPLARKAHTVGNRD